MQIEALAITEVKLLTPRAFGDERGFFLESFNARVFAEAGLPTDWRQDNHSRSRRGVVRGLHYQLHEPQGKLVRVTRGRVFDVAVDIRRSSETFGKWVGAELSDENHAMLFVPPGFAHGFAVLSDVADFVYKCTTLWDAPSDRAIRWNDPAIGISWPIPAHEAELSGKDAIAPLLADAEVFG
jgi:dTDP-4-dehydrorhamnose 3,5-epimerase